MEEVAELRGIGFDLVRHGALTVSYAQILEHHIISLGRNDVRAWLKERNGMDRDGLADARGKSRSRGERLRCATR